MMMLKVHCYFIFLSIHNFQKCDELIQKLFCVCVGGSTTFFVPSHDVGFMDSYAVTPRKGCVLVFPHGEVAGTIFCFCFVYFLIF
jgi:hypothetical protein